jgi:hypothetical protein
MKKIIYYALAIFLFSSCSDFLDLQPLSSLSESSYWLLPQDAESALVGCYNSLTDHTGTYERSNNGEILSPETITYFDCFTPIGDMRPGGPDIYACARGTLVPNNYSIWVLWSNSYLGIARCNDLLDHLDGIPFPDNQKQRKDEIKGEALFLRSFWYFLLVQQWGDIPLILHTQTVTEGRDVTRDSKDLVYTQILADLDLAIAALPDNASVGRVSKGAALTLKAKVQMVLKDFQGAATSTKAIMDLGVYSLYPDYHAIFEESNENNSEVIFDIQFQKDIFPSTFSGTFSSKGHQAEGYSKIWGTRWLIDKYEYKVQNAPYTKVARISDDVYKYLEGRDPRMDYTVYRPGVSFLGKGDQVKAYPYGIPSYQHCLTTILLRKSIKEGNDGAVRLNGGINKIVYRYADVLLLNAEANAELGKLDQETADATINKVRTRPTVEMPPITVSSFNKPDLINYIRDERIRELALEGVIYFDMKRWRTLDLNNNFDVLGFETNATKCVFMTVPVYTRVFFDFHYLWPIPQKERNLNPNLTQNPGYGE